MCIVLNDSIHPSFYVLDDYKYQSVGRERRTYISLAETPQIRTMDVAAFALQFSLASHKPLEAVSSVGLLSVC
jgi:hypothetical protein